MLNIQFRMDPRISRLSKMLFYNDEIADGTVKNTNVALAL